MPKAVDGRRSEMLDTSFEELVKHKATKQATAATLREQARDLGFITEEQWDIFKIGSWDAMIYDMAMALNIDPKKQASRQYRAALIQKWLSEGL